WKSLPLSAGVEGRSSSPSKTLPWQTCSPDAFGDSIGEIGRRFELRTSKTGTSEIASVQDIYPMPREVSRRAAPALCTRPQQGANCTQPVHARELLLRAIASMLRRLG